MGDLDKTSIVILVCVLTAAVITICLIVIIVYRKKWCRKSEDPPEISGSISISDIREYEDEVSNAEHRSTQSRQISTVFWDAEYRDRQRRQISTAFSEHRNTQRTENSQVVSDSQPANPKRILVPVSSLNAEHRDTPRTHNSTVFSDAQHAIHRGTIVYGDFEHLGAPMKKVANLKDVAEDKPLAWTPPPPPPPPDPPNPNS